MDNVSFYFPIAKIDREQRMVFGYASTPTRDLDGEVIELDAIKDALPDYMQWCNIREMHQPSAVGVAKEANIDDRGLYIGAKVVDDDAWKKVTEEVYKGFSIGGNVTERKGSTITGLELIEISLVDRPANPDCKIDVVKATAMGGERRAPVAAIRDLRANVLARGDDVILAPEEVGLFGRLIAKLAGRSTGTQAPSKADNKSYREVEHADPGYQEDGEKRYPIDTEEHIRAAWNYIHQKRNAVKYSPDELMAIKRRIIEAWREKIDENGPPEAKSMKGNDNEPVDDRDEIPAGRDGFSRPAKAVNVGVALNAEDWVADVVRRVFKEAGTQAGVSSGVRNMAEADLSKGAVLDRRGEHMSKAAQHLGEAHECCTSGMECVAKAMRARKSAGADEANYLAEAHEHLAMAHHHHVLAMHHLGKVAGGHKGEVGEQAGDAEGGIYKPESGLTPLSLDHMTEGKVPAYDVDRPYPGKGATPELVKALEEAAYLRGKVEALEKQPASPKARLFAVPRGSMPVGETEEPSAMEKLLKGVNVDAASPAERQAAAGRMLGNMIAHAGTFARPIIGDPTFRGGAGR